MSTENNIDYPEDDIGTNWCVMMINASPGRGDAKQLSAQRPWEEGELEVDLQKKRVRVTNIITYISSRRFACIVVPSTSFSAAFNTSGEELWRHPRTRVNARS